MSSLELTGKILMSGTLAKGLFYLEIPGFKPLLAGVRRESGMYIAMQGDVQKWVVEETEGSAKDALKDSILNYYIQLLSAGEATLQGKELNHLVWLKEMRA